MLISGKTIFISALDWGLGHATRCVPLVKELKKNNTLIIGITSLTKGIFEEEFPDLPKVFLPEYNICYSTIFPVWFKVLIDWPKIKQVIKSEKEALEKIIARYQVNLIISDNRFGLYTKNVHSVFITHQVFLKTPFLNALAHYFNKKYILNFDEVWIPDYEDEKRCLSGELSHGKHFHPNVKYIGPQSRLEKRESVEVKYDYLIIVSGPQPQHRLMAKQLVTLCDKYPQSKFALTSALVHIEPRENLEVFYQPNAQQLAEIITQSKSIICRSGYSTLMDLEHLEKKRLLLVPTKGQTEQEYLANYWMEKFKVQVVSENNFQALHLD